MNHEVTRYVIRLSEILHFTTEQVGPKITLESCIQEVHGSNLDRDTGSPGCFSWFSVLSRNKWRDATWIRSRPHPSISFPFHQSSPYAVSLGIDSGRQIISWKHSPFLDHIFTWARCFQTQTLWNEVKAEWHNDRLNSLRMITFKWATTLSFSATVSSSPTVDNFSAKQYVTKGGIVASCLIDGVCKQN
jgi:hypothetical protein